MVEIGWKWTNCDVCKSHTYKYITLSFPEHDGVGSVTQYFLCDFCAETFANRINAALIKIRQEESCKGESNGL